MQIRQIVRSAVLQTSEAARGWLNGGSLCPGSAQLCYAAGRYRGCRAVSRHDFQRVAALHYVFI